MFPDLQQDFNPIDQVSASVGDVGLVVVGQRAQDALGRQDAPGSGGPEICHLEDSKKSSRGNLFPQRQSIFFEFETMGEPMNRSKSTTCLSLLFLTGLTITAFAVWITFDCPPAGVLADDIDAKVLSTLEESVAPDALASLWFCRSMGGTDASGLLFPARTPSSSLGEENLPARRVFLLNLLRHHPPNGPPQHPFFSS